MFGINNTVFLDEELIFANSGDNNNAGTQVAEDMLLMNAMGDNQGQSGMANTLTTMALVDDLSGNTQAGTVLAEDAMLMNMMQPQQQQPMQFFQQQRPQAYPMQQQGYGQQQQQQQAFVAGEMLGQQQHREGHHEERHEGQHHDGRPSEGQHRSYQNRFD
jgi:hypothetical protein